MEFSFDDIKNKENLLARYSEEEIMEAMGVPISEERFCSPFRNDDHPTCSLWRASGNDVLYFMDWAVLDKPLDVFALYMYAYGCEFGEAVTGLWGLMEGWVPGKTPGTRGKIKIRQMEDVKLKVLSREWTEIDHKWWRSFGILPDTLIRFGVSPVKFMWLGQDLYYQYSGPVVYPAYVYEDGENLKVYFPFKKKFRFYQNNGSAVQGIKQLPLSGKVLVITKSLKDVMLLYEFGIPAVAPQSESVTLNEETLDDLKSRFDNVVVLFDNDHAGITALRRYKKLGFPILMLSRHEAKDISDYYRKYGAEMTKQLVEQTKRELLR